MLDVTNHDRTADHIGVGADIYAGQRGGESSGVVEGDFGQRTRFGHGEIGSYDAIIRLADAATEAGGKLQWNAKADFQGPPSKRPQPLDAWGQFAQALLMSNEFVFVD